jgi:hypothetical protein
MPVEMTDEQAAVLNGAHRLMDQLLSNPKTKHVVEGAIKQIHPTVVTDVDRAAPLIGAIRNVDAKLNQTINYLKSKEIDSNLGNQFAKIKADYGFTDDGIDEIKKLMVKEKIASPEAAAALYDRRNPPVKPQEPTFFGPTSWDLGRINDDEDLKLLWKDEDRWAEKQAQKVMRDIAKGTYRDDID